MEKKEKDHIISNIDKLIGCTKNETDWYHELLAKNFFNSSTWQRINKTEFDSNSRIREMYLECLKTPEYNLLIQSLKNSNNAHAAKILEKLSTTSSNSGEGKNELLWFGLRKPTKHYKGRKEELEKIHEYWIESFRNDSLIFVSITGLGGIGKSELARKYAHSFYTANMGDCIWINAENINTFTDSFFKLANKLGIPLTDSVGKEKNINLLTHDVLDSLSKQRYLIVFDNLESDEKYFSQSFMDYILEIPPMKSKPFVILTSRYQLVIKEFGDLAEQLELTVLSEDLSISFFKDALTISEQEVEVVPDLKKLCEQLDNLPLAMQQAAAYINQMQGNANSSFKVKNYLHLFEVESKKLLEHKIPKYQDPENFSKPVYLTWQITLNKINDLPGIGSLVVPAINIISFFESENISVKLLKSILILFSSESSYVDLTSYDEGTDIFEILANYSMCQMNQFEYDVYLSVHRLVQTVSQIKLKEEKKWEQTLNALLQICSDIFQATVTISDIGHIVKLVKFTEKFTTVIAKPKEFHHLLQHVYNLYKDKGMYQQNKNFTEFAVQQCRQIFGNEDNQTLLIMSAHGDCLFSCGEIQEADSLLNEVYEKQHKHFRHLISTREIVDPRGILFTLNNISNVRQDQEKYDEALKILFEILEIKQRLHGAEHPDTLTTKNNIAVVYNSKGNHDEALKIYLEVLEVNKRDRGLVHPSTLSIKNNIALVLDSKGNYNEALEMFMEVLENRKNVLGIDHPATLTTRNNLAFTHSNKGNYDEALKIYLEVLENKEKVLGIDHPSTLSTKNNVASIYNNVRDYDKALKMLFEILETRTRVVGNDHPFTLTIKANIASTYDRMGNYDEALKILLEVLEIGQRVFGIDHPNTFSNKYKLASTHVHIGNYDAALILFLEVVDIQTQILGSEHQDTLTTKHSIALTLLFKGNSDQALKIFLEVLAIRERVLGIDHPDTLTSKRDTARTHLKKGSSDQALTMYMEVLEIQEQILGNEHHDTLETKDSIGMTLFIGKRYDEALYRYLEVLEIRKRVLGINHPDTLTTKNNIALTYDRKGNYDAALKMYLKVLEITQQILGIDHPNTLEAKTNTASTHEKKGNYEEALQMYFEVLEIIERVNGIDHPSVLIIKNNIASMYDRKGNFNESLKLYLEVLEIQGQVPGIDHKDVIKTKNNIASVYNSKGNFDEALKMYGEVIEIQQRVLGVDNSDTFTVKNIIASIYEKKGNYDEMIKIYFEMLGSLQRVFGLDHPYTIKVKSLIALTHDKKGNCDDAVKLYLEILPIQERVLGIDHPDTENLLQLTRSLTVEEYHVFSLEVMKRSPCTKSQKNVVKNFITDSNKKKDPEASGVKGPSVCRGNFRFHPGANKPEGSGMAKPSVSGENLGFHPDADKSHCFFEINSINLMYRGDVILAAKRVFMDVEKVEIASSHKQLAATIAFVDENGKLCLHALVKHDEVCKYYPSLTGLNAEIMKKGISPKMAKALVSALQCS